MNPDQIALVFLNAYHRVPGGDADVQYRAAVFDVSGRRVGIHDWTSKHDDPYFVGGHQGGFWLRSARSLDLLQPSYETGVKLAINLQTYVLWSNSDDSLALIQGRGVSLFRGSVTSPSVHLDMPDN